MSISVSQSVSEWLEIIFTIVVGGFTKNWGLIYRNKDGKFVNISDV